MTQMKYEEEVLRDWIEALTEAPKKELTSWELGFIESALSQLDRNHFLTERQIDKLEEIYADKT